MAQVINKATWIVKAKVVEVKPGSDNWGHLQFKVEKVEVIKGDSKDASLLLNFQAQATANEVDDGNGGKIRKWYMRPQSGQELNIKKDETWFFFSSSSEKDKNGLIQIFRAEPVEQERIIKDLLKNKDK